MKLSITEAAWKRHKDNAEPVVGLFHFHNAGYYSDSRRFDYTYLTLWLGPAFLSVLLDWAGTSS